VIGAGFIGAEAAAPYRALSPEMVMIRALPVSLSAAPGLGLSAVRAGLRATSGVALLTGTTFVESPTAADGAGRRRHDVEKIAQGIGGRRIIAIACTHAHDDHVNQAPALSKRFNAPVLLHPAEAPLWEMTHPDRRPDMELADGDGLCAGGSSCGCCTPRHSPGSSCLYAPQLNTVSTGDTLFQGGLGATGRSLFVRHDHRVEPRQTSHPARRHHRPHRARRLHHRWGRGTPPRQVDRPPTLMSAASQFLEGSAWS
jgi:glyoxylase-like metal-dependent hydrolase (beta-lactamase superfamily II)